LVPLEGSGIQAAREHGGQMGRPVTRATRALPVLRETPEVLELRECRERLDSVENREIPERLVHRARPELPDLLDTRAQRVLRDLKDLQVRPEQLGHEEPPDSRVRLVLPDQPDRKDCREALDTPGRSVRLDRPVLPDLLERPGKRATPERRVRLERPVHRGPPGHQELPERWE